MRMCVMVCKCVEYSHVFPTSYLQHRKGPAVPERDMQKMDRVKITLRRHYGMVFRITEDACDQNFRTFSSDQTEARLREHLG